MAHFAKLDENNIVTSVIVISNDCCRDSDGQEREELGIAFCQSLYKDGARWVQTSYNANIRGKYAGVGDIYNEVDDIFTPPEPLDAATAT